MHKNKQIQILNWLDDLLFFAEDRGYHMALRDCEKLDDMKTLRNTTTELKVARLHFIHSLGIGDDQAHVKAYKAAKEAKKKRM